MRLPLAVFSLASSQEGGVGWRHIAERQAHGVSSCFTATAVVCVCGPGRCGTSA